jgi:2-keto-3-deoxy-L-rhamnonate aldolase RhmA
VREKLLAGGKVYGTSLGDRLDAELPIILAAAGIDFFFVDTEHSAITKSKAFAGARGGRAWFRWFESRQILPH